MKDKRPLIGESCVFCGMCKDTCPQKAITIDAKTEFSDADFKQYSGVWSIMQIDSASGPKKVSYELLSEARKLSDRLGQKATALCLCKSLPQSLLESVEQLGADELLLIEDDLLQNYNTDIFTGIISGLIVQKKPSIVLFPATEDGRDLAPRVAGRLRAGLTADCTALDIDDQNRLLQIRPTYGGNIMASIITPHHRPQMASIRPNVFRVETCARPVKTAVIKMECKIDPSSIRVKRMGTQKKETVYKDVLEAEIIIAGGYGTGKENFKLIHELAVKTGAAVGATRKVVDEGWAPFDIQIGQTGKTVAPELYIACGISGALQHSIGIKNAKKIIAINNDPTAQIFSMSDVSILGDVGQILQELIGLASTDSREALMAL
jgi:electron transfer flavoprotein alpha subunit